VDDTWYRRSAHAKDDAVELQIWTVLLEKIKGELCGTNGNKCSQETEGEIVYPIATTQGMKQKRYADRPDIT
jgi:hypothetical protein